MSSLELSKAVVLKSREQLLKISVSNRLTKQQFVDVCLNATKKFLRDRSRASPPHHRETGAGAGTTTPRRAGGGGLQLSTREEYLLNQILEAEATKQLSASTPGTPRGGGAHHHQPQRASRGSTYVQDYPEVGLSSFDLPVDDEDEYAYDDEVEYGGNSFSVPPQLHTPSHHNHQQHHRQEQQQLQQRQQSQNGTSNRRTPHTASAASPSSTARHHRATKNEGIKQKKHHPEQPSSSDLTSHVHPIQVATIHATKRVLDPVYSKGMISKADYTDAVLSITTEALRCADERRIPFIASEGDEIDMQNGGPVVLSEEFVAIVQEMASGVAHYFLTQGEATRDVANTAVKEAADYRKQQQGKRGGRGVAGSSRRSPPNQRGGPSATAVDHNDDHDPSLITVKQEEDVFDAQVALIQHMISVATVAQNSPNGGSTGTTAQGSSRAVGGSSRSPPGVTNVDAKQGEGAGGEEDGKNAAIKRRQALETELRLLESEMSTIAARVASIRRELAS